MKNLKKLFVVCVLTLVLALPAFAGNMETTVVSTPPPPDSSSATTQGNMGTGITGDMGTGVTGNMEAGVTATDSATGVMLSLVQSLAAFF